MRNKLRIFLPALILLTAAWAFSQPPAFTAMPVKYEADRFFLEAVIEGGGKVRFFTDSGGGLFMYKHAAERLKLPVSGSGDNLTIEMPKFGEGQTIPPPPGTGGRLFLLEKGKNAPHSEYDSMLGQAWFGDRIWTFDYPARRLLLWDKTPKIIDKASKHRVNFAFKTDEAGKRLISFPRTQIEVDGVTIEMLFDTGATTYLSPEALTAVNDGGPAERATSFIVNTIFEKWRKDHPDWRIVEKAESTTGEAMIEARNIKIAGHTIKRAWFTRRADKNFHEYMTQFMDKKIEGAVGGTLLHPFRITVDYPKAIAVFEK
jgi:hypothetical protein